MKRRVMSLILAIILALPISLALPPQEALALPDGFTVYGTTSNLVVNGGAESSARNFPYYGWTKLNGNCDWSSYTEFLSGKNLLSSGTLIKPVSGSYLLAPVVPDSSITTIITNVASAPLYALDNLPGLIPGGYTPGNMPSGHTPGQIPSGMPSIPGLPDMPGLPGVPGMPSGNSNVTGLPGIPSLPGMNGFSVPGVPGIPSPTDIIDWITNFSLHGAEAETTLVQEIDVSLFKDYIDTGRQDFNFSGRYCSDGGNHKAQILISYHDGSHPVNLKDEKEVPKRFTDSKYAAEKPLEWDASPEYSGSDWKEYNLNYQLPVGTRKVYVYLRVWKSFGGTNYAGFFDDISFTMPVYKPPMPEVERDSITVRGTSQIRSYAGWNIPILFTSLTPDIASVDANGLVTGLQAGAAKILVSDKVFTNAGNVVTIAVDKDPFETPEIWIPRLNFQLLEGILEGTSDFYASGLERVSVYAFGSVCLNGENAVLMPSKRGAPHVISPNAIELLNPDPDGMRVGEGNYTEDESPLFYSWIITKDWEPGDWEVRICSDKNNPSAATLVKTIPFRVLSPLVTEQPPTPPTPPTPPIPPSTPPTPPTPPTVVPETTGLTVQAIDSGVKLEWPKASGNQLYRVYRSTTPGDKGISITDFALTATNYIDVNVNPSTTYYYSFCQVLADADPWNDIPEKTGTLSSAKSVTTLKELLQPVGKGEKHYILMKVESPTMTVDGIVQELDPGRGTTPVNRNGRIVLPIRAVIETIGGSIGWDEATKQITLKTANNEVIMWLDETDLVTNGKTGAMDVAPVSINGRTMVPVRFAAESSGCKVEWLNATNEIVVVFYFSEPTGTP